MLQIQQDLYKPPNNSKITNNNNNRTWSTFLDLFKGKDQHQWISLKKRNLLTQKSFFFFMDWLWSNDNFFSHLQEANDVHTNPIQDSKANFLEKEMNDMVQPCDTTQEGLDLDFGVKLSTVQFYAIEYSSKSNRWIKLKFYQKIPEVLVYIGVKLTSLNCCLGIWNFLIANTFLQQ